MYEGVKTWNPFVGCKFDCVYCKPSFQRQAKRRKKWCELCYQYKPHFHPERLNRVPNVRTIFACGYGDISHARIDWLGRILEVIEKHEDKTFYLQTKNPDVFLTIANHIGIPKNIKLGVTLETCVDEFSTPSKYRKYSEISRAPKPTDRLRKIFFHAGSWRIDYVTIEPILDFPLNEFVSWLQHLKPEFVYIGYDNWNCRLPEPQLKKTLKLIEELEKFTEVRLKTIRKAWWEFRSDEEGEKE